MNNASVSLFSLFFFFIITACTHQIPLSEDHKKQEVLRLNNFFDEVFETQVARYPTSQTYLGRKTNYGLLDNETEAYAQEEHRIAQETLKQLKDFNLDALDDNAKLSYRIMRFQLEKQIEGYRWRYHQFPLNQMFGYHSGTPSFLINMHQIDNKSDAEAYISRLKEIERVFAERMAFVQKQEKLGIVPPHFVFDKILEDSRNIISGKPFDSQGESPLYNDFKTKVEKLKLPAAQKKKLLAQAESALQGSVLPAYQELITYIEGWSKKYSLNQGAWSLPDGKEFYKFRLKSITTTDKSWEEIHATGLAEVARIHEEMREIMKQVGFAGSLAEFFEYMKSDKFLYPSTPAGRKAYLKKTNEIVDNIKPTLPKLFNTFPKAPLVVKPVEAFREKSAGTAFYSGPSLEGNRPGIYYINLYKMADNPKYKLEALTYHEAIPGHHMQIAIAKELEELPKFRRAGGFTAYVEGWGLYSELLPKEIGFYQDPYSDFGRLAMEVWRANRLVVDTGIHVKKWTREQAIKYMTENTPSAELETIKEIERYFVMPAQATAYKVGMMKILDLRAKAKKAMGDKFDIREFHDVVLRDGALPLEILEQRVGHWIQRSLLQ
jgi:uncharacterized protein (DUF885 family)